VVLIIPSLAAGGAQRVIVQLANHWAQRRWPISLVTLAARHEDFFTLHSGIARLALGLTGESSHPIAAIAKNLQRIRRLRTAIRHAHPDVIISFIDQTNVLTLLAAVGLRIPVVVAERTDPRHHAIGRVWSALRRWTYPWADAVVVQTVSVQRFVENAVAGCAVRVVPNAVCPPAVPDSPAIEVAERRVICGAGRLSQEKGFDRLIEAFGQVAGKFPGWRLLIYGDGPERKRLEQLAAQRAPGRVELPGWAADVAAMFREAAIFALPSRYEGFPNSLLEAMSHGVPAVCFDCESGPSEIVRHELDGLLVPPDDIPGFAHALERLMADAETRRQFGRRATDVTQRFSMEKFLGAWEALVDEVS
jgi:glycosyltransferase involved in cell wall biosynthesis